MVRLLAVAYLTAGSLCDASRHEGASMMQIGSVSAAVANRAERLSAMQQKVLEFAKSGVPDEAVPFLQGIKTTLEDDVLASLTEEARLQKVDHDGLYGAFATIQDAYDGDIAVIVSGDTRTGVSGEHMSCRALESVDHEETVTCAGEQATAQSLYDAAATLAQSRSEAAGVCVGANYDWRNSGGLSNYQSAVANYKTAIGDVISTRNTLENKIDECGRLDGELATQKTACDGKQTTYETTACAYALSIHTRNDAYTSAYGTTADTFTGEFDTWNSEFDNRKHQCQTVNTLICYIDALAANDPKAALQAAIASCDSDKDTYDCSAMEFTISGQPGQGALTAIPPAPCAANFAYGDFPLGTELGACSACAGL